MAAAAETLLGHLVTYGHPLYIQPYFLRPMICHVLSVDFPAVVPFCVYSCEQSTQKSPKKNTAPKNTGQAHANILSPANETQEDLAAPRMMSKILLMMSKISLMMYLMMMMMMI